MFCDGEFSNLKKLIINEKEVYLVDSHEYVLPIWANYAISNHLQYSLVTFDYHTDTRLPFTKFACTNISRTNSFPDREKFRAEHIKKINAQSVIDIVNATKNLCNDEHIQAAMLFGFVRIANVITVNETHPDFNINYFITENFFGLAPPVVSINPYNHEFSRLVKFRLNRLEDDYINSTGFVIPSDPIILDFDLDYFPTRESLKPRNCKIIKQLICGAEVITIAREKEYCNEGLEQEGFTSEEAEVLLIKLIETCTSN